MRDAIAYVPGQRIALADIARNGHAFTITMRPVPYLDRDEVRYWMFVVGMNGTPMSEHHHLSTAFSAVERYAVV